jgi:hypothetical protein
LAVQGRARTQYRFVKALRDLHLRWRGDRGTKGEYERAIETLECLHPNVFTLAEVRAMQGKKGKPPGPKRSQDWAGA